MLTDEAEAEWRGPVNAVTSRADDGRGAIERGGQSACKMPKLK